MTAQQAAHQRPDRRFQTCPRLRHPAKAPDQRSGGGAARVDFRHAFHIATAGGGKALDLPIGQFSPGYRFDALMIDSRARAGTLRLWDEFDQGEGILQKIVFTASRGNIASVWVDCRAVVNI